MLVVTGVGMYYSLRMVVLWNDICDSWRDVIFFRDGSFMGC